MSITDLTNESCRNCGKQGFIGRDKALEQCVVDHSVMINAEWRWTCIYCGTENTIIYGREEA